MITDILFGGMSYETFFKGCIDCVFFVLDFFFSWINLPQIPSEIYTSINNFLNIIFDNASLVGFFIRIDTVKILLPLVIAVVSYKYYYKIIMWVVNKIPFIGID